MSYDLFISYSRRDNQEGRITQLVDRIKADFAPFAKRELVPFFDQQEIHGMQDWRQSILQGLRESRLLLACLSPAYLQSEYCEWEFVEYLKYEIGRLHGFNGIAPIYFVEVPGWSDKNLDQNCDAWVAELRRRQNFDLRPWHDQGEEALRETAVQERLGNLNAQIVQTITRGERAEKSLGNVDAHNPHFIGRTANLRMLRDNFVKPGHIGVVTAVNGVGGLGKTALAIEYAHAFADEYGGGRWQVRCAGKDDLRLALAELATPIGFEFTDEEKKNADLQFERTRRELKQLADARAPHRCLLLLDNVNRPGLLDPEQVTRLNGGDWLHVLATTRLGENELHGAHHDRSFLAVDELPPDDAIALIESYQPDGHFRSETERDAARELVRLLGCFTLAVESAAVYLGQFANDVTCAAFLTRLNKEGVRGLDEAAQQSSEGVLHGEKRLGATLTPTLERLTESEKLALSCAAFLPSDNIPLPWMRALVAETFPEIGKDAEPGYPDAWKNLLRRLVGLRLWQITSVSDVDNQPLVVRMHRLVKMGLIVEQWAGIDVIPQAPNLLTHARKRAESLWEGWVHQENRWELEPLCAAALDWMSVPPFSEIGSLIANYLSRPLRLLGHLDVAESLLRKALPIIESHYGASHPNLASARSNLAGVLKAMGRTLEARKLLEESGCAMRQNLNERTGESQPVSVNPELSEYGRNAAVFSNLADITENPTENEQLLQTAVELYSKMGPNPELGGALGKLGLVIGRRGDLDRAEELFTSALLILEQTAPEGDWMGDALANLGNLFRIKGQFDDAVPLLERSLNLKEKLYGQINHRAADTQYNYARALFQVGKPLEAIEYFRLSVRSLEHFEQETQQEHPAIKQVRMDMAQCLAALGHTIEGSEPLRPATEIESDHQNRMEAARNLINLSELAIAQGDIPSALRNAQKSVFIATKSNSDALRAVSWARMADALHQAGQHDNALARFKGAETSQARSEPQHPILYSLSGFQYCDLLLGKAEQIAWRFCLGKPIDNAFFQTFARLAHEPWIRAMKTLEWAMSTSQPLSIGLDFLTLSRSTLYVSLLPVPLADEPRQDAKDTISSALGCLRNLPVSDAIASALRTSAWLRFLENDDTGAWGDLDEAWDIAERGEMRLHMADIHLHRARLFFREKRYPWKSPQDDLAAAEKLINDCGYHRRDEELTDAKRAILGG